MIERTLQKFLHAGDEAKATVIFGSRRVGKTTLLRQIAQSGRTLWINGDIPEDANAVNFASRAEVQAFLKQADTIIIDEAQRIPSIGLQLKMLVDENEQLAKKTKLFATGSSSLELAGGVQESAVGRLKKWTLWPISFNELAHHKGLFEAKRELPLRLIYGLYPAIVNDSENAQQILEDYCEGILFKDIFSLSGIRKPKQFQNLLVHLAQAIGSEISYDSLARNTGLSKQAVVDYIDLLEQCFIVRCCNAYARNIAKEIKKGKKIYFCDLGVRNYLLKDFAPLNTRSDVGALWENFFFMERLKHHEYHKTFTQQYFWRTAESQPKEIDFIEVTDGQLEAFECKFSDKAKADLPVMFKKAYGEVPFHVISPQSAIPFITEEGLSSP